MKKLIVVVLFLIVLSIQSIAQSPFKNFLSCIEQLRNFDTIVKLEKPIYIRILNDSISHFQFSKTERKEGNIHLLYTQELFFDRIEYFFVIDSFINLPNTKRLRLICNPLIIFKLKSYEIIYIEVVCNSIDNNYSISIKRN